MRQPHQRIRPLRRTVRPPHSRRPEIPGRARPVDKSPLSFLKTYRTPQMPAPTSRPPLSAPRHPLTPVFTLKADLHFTDPLTVMRTELVPPESTAESRGAKWIFLPLPPFPAAIPFRPVPASRSFSNSLVFNPLPGFPPKSNPLAAARFHLSPPARTSQNQGRTGPRRRRRDRRCRRVPPITRQRPVVHWLRSGQSRPAARL